MPMHRLGQYPSELGHFALTWDSDGRLDRFIADCRNKPLLELHSLRPEEPFLISMFGGATRK